MDSNIKIHCIPTKMLAGYQSKTRLKLLVTLELLFKQSYKNKKK